MALGERRSRESPWSFPRQTNKQNILSTHRFELSTLAFLAQCSYRLSYRAVLIWLLLSDYYYQITIIRLTKNFGHTAVRTLDPRVFSTMLLPTDLQGRTFLITHIRLLLSDYYYPGCDWNPDPTSISRKLLTGSNRISWIVNQSLIYSTSYLEKYC